MKPQEFNEKIVLGPDKTVFQGMLALMQDIIGEPVIAFSAQDVLTKYEKIDDKKSFLEDLKAEKDYYLEEGNAEGANNLQQLIDLLNPPKSEQIETNENNCKNTISIK